VFGMDVKLTEKLSGTAELAVAHDEDPSGHSSQALAGLSVDWTPNANTQLDLGTNLGLDRNAPDAELYFGVVRRF
jgi:hypothetical protein